MLELRKKLARWLLKDTALAKIEERLKHLSSVVEYLEHQNRRAQMILRHVSAPMIHDLPFADQTRKSFDFQWDKVPRGRFMLDNEKFREDATGYVCQFTQLPAEWFKDKDVVDIGCGQGRYSWAMLKLGARVLSVDQSDYGLKRTAEACKEYKHHRTLNANVLDPLPISDKYDLVWSFGVIHHTGDTYKAFKNIVPLVKNGGYLFLMIYGEPRRDDTLDYMSVNEYERWRWKTFNMDLSAKLEAIKQGMLENQFMINGEEHVHGYFDAIAPSVNDLYSYEEVEAWFIDSGFSEIKRTVLGRNIHIIGRKI